MTNRSTHSAVLADDDDWDADEFKSSEIGGVNSKNKIGTWPELTTIST